MAKYAKQKSPLLQLPAELRTRIYELVLEPPEGIDIYVCRRGRPVATPALPPDFTDVERSQIRNRLNPNVFVRNLLTTTPTPYESRALTRTCWQVREETEGFNYSKNKFNFHTFALGMNPCLPSVYSEGTFNVLDMPRGYFMACQDLLHSWFQNLVGNSDHRPTAIDLDMGRWEMNDDDFRDLSRVQSNAYRRAPILRSRSVAGNCKAALADKFNVLGRRMNSIRGNCMLSIVVAYSASGTSHVHKLRIPAHDRARAEELLDEQITDTNSQIVLTSGQDPSVGDELKKRQQLIKFCFLQTMPSASSTNT